MYVGLLRKNYKTGILARTLTYMCSYYNIHFFVFTYEDVDIKNNSIQGLFFKNGKWIKQVTEFPDVVDNVPMDRKKYPKIFDALSKKSIMTTPGLGPKSFIYDKMRTSDKLKKYLIPFKSISSYSDLEELLISYKSVIIKPHLSNQGKGIFKMDIDKHSVNISTDTEKWSIALSQLSDFYYKELKNINTVAQPFINSKTKDDSPFDIRVHVRKVSNHNWRKVAMYPRIGIYKNITSNVNSGGAVSPLVPFLKKNFQKSWLDIKEDLDLLYEEIISSIEGLFNKNIDALGVDVGIDTNGRLWIFEINTFPAQNYYFAEDSEPRVLYYKWLIENKA